MIAPRRIVWRGSPSVWAPLAVLAGAAWPPLIAPMAFLPPARIELGPHIDWRLAALVVGVVAVGAAFALVLRERDRTGSPSTRLGVIWRFLLYGGLLSAALQTALTLGLVVARWGEAGTIAQSLGAAETTVLIYGVAFLPVTMLVGLSYALWAGLCVALIAFTTRPAPLRPRVDDYAGAAPET